jgi:hypothetical protein
MARVKELVILTIFIFLMLFLEPFEGNCLYVLKLGLTIGILFKCWCLLKKLAMEATGFVEWNDNLWKEGAWKKGSIIMS